MSSNRPPRRPLPVFTPFFRRFTDERANDLNATISLYNRVQKAFRKSKWSKPEIFDAMIVVIFEQISPQPPPHLHDAFKECIAHLLQLETTVFSFPDTNPARDVLSLKDQVDLRRFLRAKEHFLAHDDATIDLLGTAVENILSDLSSRLPQLAHDQQTPLFTVPLASLVTNPAQHIDHLIGIIAQDQVTTAGLFTTLQHHLYGNICRVSGIDPSADTHKGLVSATDAKIAPAEKPAAYLAGTPFLDLIAAPVPFVIPRDTFSEHGCGFAPSGWGKTQLLQAIILDFMSQSDPPTLFIMDSHGTMLRQLEMLDQFHPEHGRLRDRLIIIDPEDESPPPLSFFDLGPTDISAYSVVHQRAILNGVDETFKYMFTALDREFTGRQDTMVTYLLRLLKQLDRPTIGTLQEIMDDPATGAAYSIVADEIAKLDPTARRFFETEFYARDMRPTRKQIASRLYTLLQNPTFEAMFNAPRNCFNAFDAMQQKKIVLINTSRLTLGRDGASIIGRYFIAQCLSAAFQRITVQKHQRHLALLIIDEASYYFDDQIKYILEETRKYNLGLLFFTQEIEQLSAGVKQALGSTAIKFAGPVEPTPARYLAETMKTTTDFIGSLNKVLPSHTEFAAFVRSLTPNAVRLTVPFFLLENAPMMSPADNAILRAHNRAQYGLTADDVLSSSSSTAPAPVRDFGSIENISVLGVQFSALLDTGAERSTIVATQTAKVGSTDRPRLSFTITTANAVHTFERPIVGSTTLVGIHGARAECPIVTLDVTLDDYTSLEPFAVSIDPAPQSQPIIIGDGFFASAPFTARIIPAGSLIAEQRQQKQQKRTSWDSDHGEVDEV